MAINLEELKQKVRQGVKVTANSKEVEKGSVFVVFEENKQYLFDAVDRGASYILMEPNHKELLGDRQRDIQIIFSSNIRKDYGELVAAYFGNEHQNFALIGITGTNGKTTTSYLVEHLLKNIGLKVGVIGTINYRWMDKVEDSKLTTPGCFELHSIVSKMRSDGVDVIIMEVSSHGLAQDRVSGLEFDFAIFTNLTQDHLDYHKNMEDYFKAKSKLFTTYLRKKGVGIVNLEDKHGRYLFDLLGDRAIGYGFKGCTGDRSGRYLKGEIVKSYREIQLLRCLYEHRQWEVSIPLLGRHNALNLLAAQGVGLAMGIKPEAFNVFNSIHQVPGRLERVDNPLGLDIYIDYAHTPDALERVLESIRELNYKRIIVVFGCGGDRDKIKRPLMGRVVSRFADLIVLTSDNPRGEDPEAIIQDILPGIDNQIPVTIEVDRKKAIKQALYLMEKGDVLVIAGKGHETYQEIGGKRYPFCDRDVVEEIVNSWN